MQIDRETLERMSRMNDADFAKAIEAAASQNGISLPSLTKEDLCKLRDTLRAVSQSPQLMEALWKKVEKNLPPENPFGPSASRK